ncbi:MAG: acyloxyacyl hydrolase [Prolixibacteraceae bacterium]|nr:acyloxyacyl hydrolase [Prolixibacteraceae bacterium]
MFLQICLVANVYSQTDSASVFFINFDYQTGENRPHRPIVENLTYPYKAANLKFGWQTNGKNDWEVAFHYPSYGIALNYGTFNTDVLGSPAAFYFFTNFPQISTRFFRIDLELNLGISHGINPYHEINNPYNFSTGSTINAIFGLYLEESFHLSPQLDFFVSEGFSHYSNGALSYPNLGLNIPSLKFGIRYLHEKPEYIGREEKLKFKHRFQLITYIGAGTKKLFGPAPSYNEVLVSPSFFLQTGYKRRIGVGFELAYNEAIKGIYKKENYSGKQLLTYGIHLSHEFLIDRFTILLQLGLYLSEPPSDKFYFERLALGYYLSDHVRFLLCIKAHYIKAEYVEAGLSFDLNFN